MPHRSKQPLLINGWSCLFLVLFSFLLALGEVLALPIFYALTRPGHSTMLPRRGFPVLGREFEAQFLWDTLNSQAVHLNILCYLAAVLLGALLVLPAALILRKYNRLSPSRQGILMGLILIAPLLFNLIFVEPQLISFLLPWFILALQSLFFLIAAALLAVMVRVTHRGVASGQGLRPGVLLGLGLFLFFNFLRGAFLNISSLIAGRIAWVAGLVLAWGLFFLGLNFFLGYLQRKWPRIVPLEKALALGMVFFGGLILTVPVWEWSKIYFKGPPSPINAWQTQSGSPSDISKEAELPNVILIVWDTVRADHLSLYGYSRPTTPFLEHLAEQAVVFDRAYATAPWTLPSHASFFTGLFLSEHHCDSFTHRLSDQYLTLAEKLSASGYVTLGYSNNYSLNRITGMAQGFDHFVVNSPIGSFSGELVFQFSKDPL